MLKTSPVNSWLNSIPNLCKTTYGNINLRSSSIYLWDLAENNGDKSTKNNETNQLTESSADAEVRTPLN
jgi:hypothetical protein